MVPKQITKNFFSLFVSNVVGQLFTLWAFVHLATIYGPEGFGKITFAQVIALYFLYLADFGLQTLGTRSIAQDRANVASHVLYITTLRVLLAIGSFALLVVVSLFLPKSGDVRTLVIVFGLSLLPSAILLEWMFQGLEKMGIVGVARILKGVVFAALVIAFCKTAERPDLAAASYVAGIAAAALVLLAVYLKRYGWPAGRMDLHGLKRTLIVAAPLAAGTLIGQINCNFGTVALGFFKSNEMVGLFSSAYKIILFLLGFAVVAAANAVFPQMAKSYKKSVTIFGESVRKLLRLFVLIAIPIGVGGSVLASKILGFLYPAQYQAATVVLQVSIWMVVIAIYRVIFENALIASRSQRSYLIGYVIAGTLTVVGNVLLVPFLGLLAPSVVGVVTELSLLAYFVASCKFVRPSYILQTTLKPVIAAVLMGLTIEFLPVNLFLLLIVGSAAYLIYLLILRCLTIRELAGYVHSLVT